ncbi:hypothetical protein BN130_1982 [Cronobacter malonaticus 507]|nr:hypothetical protein BN130_1982 [Cronobacter malonaticus 507]
MLCRAVARAQALPVSCCDNWTLSEDPITSPFSRAYQIIVSDV